ncbi:peptide/nickel transport system permease protein [Salana multivorans]|uniref:Oligopeptide transport system permease protein OppC n=1 Tax=Salana multivorans TaxID=120377 RepID=A0A3N2D816_9MICO|nr:ABC transporter permease [Salana multivorans]MBN8881812.1 ABC transporter permease [Salana multivorans]OJX98375.1 MAG: ABC transporter permease [Micrococcales bacterium 73-15]ROR95798.1 peptide/nickel transport system permease protein [Salana multivorans]
MSSPENLENVRPVDAAAGGTDGDDVKGLSQGAIVRKRFRGHTGAMVSIVVLAFVVILAITSIGLGPIPGWWKYGYAGKIPTLVDGGRPSLQLWPFSLGEHPFGQDSVGRDYFAMTMRGIQISLFITVVVGAIAAFVGVVIGACSGYFRGKVETVLMRFTDVIIIIPALVAAAVVGQNASDGGVLLLGVFLGLVSWTGMARLTRGDFLTLREREFVDAARLAGASNNRIIFKHILPNAVGVITVNTTLLMSAAILTETALSYLGFGVQAPDTSLGKLISENQAAFSTRPWLFWFPGIFIIVICLCINFIGDGLRDAFDPRQKKISLRRVADTGEAERRREANARIVSEAGATTSGPPRPLDQRSSGFGIGGLGS